MSKISDQPIQTSPTPDRQSSRQAYKKLRKLLIGPEYTDLKRFRTRVEDPKLRAKDISLVLPEAVIMQAKEDNRMVSALRPTVEEIIQVSVKRDPKPLVDALFPIIGPAIRKSVAEAFRQMMQSLNTTLEYSTSLKGLKWRLQAFRTGKPFAEVVLLNSLLYRVEQIFLIHRETGLLLSHTIAEGVTVKDGDMVSGMLAAINDFIRDSFSPGKSDTLTSVHVGGTTIIIEEGPHVYLAGVVRGNPPERLRIRFKETLEGIHLEFGEELIHFNGDTNIFKAAPAHLAPCLLTQSKPKARKTSPLMWIILAAIVGFSTIWAALWIRDQMRWSDYIDRLRREPGIVVTFKEKRGGKFRVSGLRDPLAIDPSTLITKFGLDQNRVVGHFEPFYAMQPQFILSRAIHLTHPPASMVLSLKDNTLVASGSAPLQWMNQNRPILTALPGISNYDESQLVASDADAIALENARTHLQPPATITLDVKNGNLIVTGRALHQWILKLNRQGEMIPGILSINNKKLIDSEKAEMEIIGRKIKQTTIDFSSGTTLSGPEDIATLNRIARLINRLQTLSASVSIPIRVHVMGHTDMGGVQQKNARLSLARAEEVRSRLIEKGVSASILSAIGTETLKNIPGAARWSDRKVSFQMVLQSHADPG
jgi:OOP family OmpA-OmpF porin